jgi:hypothetical protein
MISWRQGCQNPFGLSKCSLWTGAFWANFSPRAGAHLSTFLHGLLLEKLLNPNGYDGLELVLFWIPIRQIRNVKYTIPKYEASGGLEQKACNDCSGWEFFWGNNDDLVCTRLGLIDVTLGVNLYAIEPRMPP